MTSLRFLILLVQLVFGLLLIFGVTWAFIFVVAAPLLALLVAP